MAAQYAKWITPGDVKDEHEIARGSGAVVREGAKKMAVYCDHHGKLHRFSAVCPHLGAILVWNPDECTWDCPAHGSRFAATGKVVNGPANGDLEPVESEHSQAS
jgi:Rieske Fe-S protein